MLRDSESGASFADKALAGIADAETVNTSIVYKAKFVVVECCTTFGSVPDIETLRLCASRLARLHARALRDSHADLTNMRDHCSPEIASILRSAERFSVRTTASVHQERFATVEYKVCTDLSGPVVLWGSGVYRLWAPASD